MYLDLETTITEEMISKSHQKSHAKQIRITHRTDGDNA